MSDGPAEPQLKVGERLARQIVEEIAAAGWPIGTVLGTEPELLERYGVSRPRSGKRCGSSSTSTPPGCARAAAAV